MKPRLIAAALSGMVGLSAGALAVGPAIVGPPARGRAAPAQSTPPDHTVTGVWEVRTGIFRGPWTITLSQTGKAVTGTIQESFPVICATEPVLLEDGGLEPTEGGMALSFDFPGPHGSTIAFKGAVNPTWDAIAFVRSATVTVTQGPAQAGLAGAALLAERDDERGFFDLDGFTGAANAGDAAPETRFTAHRVDPTALTPPGCRVAEAPTSTAGAAERPKTRRYLASGIGVGFAPWIFDLTIGNGLVAGTVTQGRLDATTRMSTIVPGPFPIVNGRATDSAIDFEITLGDGARVVTFHGTRSGAEAIAFQRRLQVASVLSGADPGANGVFGPGAATRFTAILDPTADPPSSIAAVAPAAGGDDTVAIDTVEARYATRAAVPGFVLVRYRVGGAFEGRLVMTATDTTGTLVRQVEVPAAPGRHVALWDLRADAGSTAGTRPRPLTAGGLETAEARATLAGHIIELATDDPERAAEIARRLAPLVTGPADPPLTGSGLASPGPYALTLVGLSGAVETPLATQMVEIRNGAPRDPPDGGHIGVGGGWRARHAASRLG